MNETKLDPLTVAELDELERLEKEASHGEFDVERYDERAFGLYRKCSANLDATIFSEADARLIAAARNALPRLIAAAREAVKATGAEQADAGAEE